MARCLILIFLLLSACVRGGFSVGGTSDSAAMTEAGTRADLEAQQDLLPDSPGLVGLNILNETHTCATPLVIDTTKTLEPSVDIAVDLREATLDHDIAGCQGWPQAAIRLVVGPNMWTINQTCTNSGVVVTYFPPDGSCGKAPLGIERATVCAAPNQQGGDYPAGTHYLIVCRDPTLPPAMLTLTFKR